MLLPTIPYKYQKRERNCFIRLAQLGKQWRQLLAMVTHFREHQTDRELDSKKNKKKLTGRKFGTYFGGIDTNQNANGTNPVDFILD